MLKQAVNAISRPSGTIILTDSLAYSPSTHRVRNLLLTRFVMDANVRQVK